ncbi:MAG TPA: MBOAT family protein [Chthoniobacteraceae bacterium]|nr:MBOAT family protein [Chthoniobacteraceae bacterium]
MNTELSDITIGNGRVFFDPDCPLCASLAARFRPILRSRRFSLLPALSGPLGVPLREMLLLTPDGRIYGGADAILHIAGYFWWAFSLRLLAGIPGMRERLRSLYRWIAAHRRCIGGRCALPRRPHWPGWLPLPALPVLAFAATARAPAWLDMWAIAGAIFLGCKWLSWWEGPRAPLGRTLAYFILWPGMDAATFLDSRNVPAAPALAEWLLASAKTALGAVLIWGVASRVPGSEPLLAGWIGMAGLIFLLHFGTFHLAALGWQRLGIQAEPIMCAPIAARSLGDFWGRRWNRGFNNLAQRFVFRPLRRRVGAPAATLLAFLASGVVHEAAISIPARGGYGLPTFYFLAQGAGLLLERSRLGRRLGLRRGVAGRVYALIVAAAPAYWLFHPLFVARVIRPFLEVLL